MNRFGSWFCKIFFTPIIRKVLIEEVRGLENVPKRNFILVSNHQSHLDEIATGFVAVPKRFHFIGQTDRYSGFTKIFLYVVYFLAGVIPLNRKSGESKKRVLKKAIEVLKEGDVLIVYPEGTRSRTGKMGEGKPGMAKIFLETGVPILPVGIKGTFDVLPPKGKLKMKRVVKVNIGEILDFKEEFEKGKKLKFNSKEYKDLAKRITDNIMEEIKKLIPK
jgi:1-acyl-sn-glycerol-3-phosphate acyltransferase